MFLRRMSIIIFKTLLQSFKKTLRTLPDRKNFTKEIAMRLCPEILSDEPECSYFEIQILLYVCKERNIFDDISKKTCTLRNVILCICSWAFRIIKLVLISSVSSASRERCFSRLQLVFNHLGTYTIISENRLDSLLVLFLVRDVVDKINI